VRSRLRYRSVGIAAGTEAIIPDPDAITPDNLDAERDRIADLSDRDLFAELADILTVHSWAASTKWGTTDRGRVEALLYSETRIAPYAAKGDAPLG